MSVSHNNQKKIAVINDFSGFGRCSITVSLPIISAMKVQCCPVPTAIFSNHTGYDSYFFEDYTDKIDSYIAEWKKLELYFDGICTGFMGSKEQIDKAIRFIDDFKKDDTVILIDPVMGDYGKLYATFTSEMCDGMREFIKYADIITPNITEACILTSTPYTEEWDISEISDMARKMSDNGPDKIVITGIQQENYIANFCYIRGEEWQTFTTNKIGTSRSGTGDVFSAILAADAVNGKTFYDSVKRASEFVKKCIISSIERQIPLTDGVCFEDHLAELISD